MLKTITFAITHFTVAFTVTYIITGSFMLGSLVATIEPAVNTVAYFFHEKLWDKFRSGALHLPSFSVTNFFSSHR